MFKVCITGTTRGIGNHLYEHFVNKGCRVVALNRTANFDTMLSEAAGCDLFINNAYASGLQIKLLNSLYTNVKRMIVCGSVVSNFPDPSMPVYSQHKLELENRFLDITSTTLPNQAAMLLLKLSGDAYNDAPLVSRVVDFWLDNPKITIISFEHGVQNK